MISHQRPCRLDVQCQALDLHPLWHNILTSFETGPSQSRLKARDLLAGAFLGQLPLRRHWMVLGAMVLSECRQDIGSTMPANRNNQAFNDLSLSGILVEVVLQGWSASATSRLTTMPFSTRGHLSSAGSYSPAGILADQCHSELRVG